MRQLVHHDVVQHFLGRPDQAPVEIQISCGAAGAPAGFRGTEADFPESDVHFFGIETGTLYKRVQRQFLELFFLQGADRRRRAGTEDLELRRSE